MSNDFYEEDEPVEKIEAILSQGTERGLTGPVDPDAHSQYLHLPGLGLAPAGANRGGARGGAGELVGR